MTHFIYPGPRTKSLACPLQGQLYTGLFVPGTNTASSIMYSAPFTVEHVAAIIFHPWKRDSTLEATRASKMLVEPLLASRRRKIERKSRY